MNKHLFCILTIIMATVMLIGCGGGGGGSASDNKNHIITGNITMGNGKLTSCRASEEPKALKNAEVWLEEIPDRKTTTDANGNYVLKDIPAGIYHVIAKYIGTDNKIYKMRSDETDASTDKTVSIPVYEAKNIVTGKITSNGIPLPKGTKLQLWGETFYVTDNNGSFTTPPLPQFPEGKASFNINATVAGSIVSNKADFSKIENNQDINVKAESKDFTATIAAYVADKPVDIIRGGSTVEITVTLAPKEVVDTANVEFSSDKGTFTGTNRTAGNNITRDYIVPAGINQAVITAKVTTIYGIKNTELKIAVSNEGYTLKYDSNGGSGNGPDELWYHQKGEWVTVADGSTLKRDGYTFICWNTKPDETGKNYNSGEGLVFDSEDVILYAVWKKPTIINSVIIRENTTWSSKNSPYYINGKIQVAQGAKLTIEAGSILYYKESEDCQIVIGGQLVCKGTEAQPIVINNGIVNGLNTSDITLEYTTLNKCKFCISDPGVTDNHTKLTAKFCKFVLWDDFYCVYLYLARETIFENNTVELHNETTRKYDAYIYLSSEYSPIIRYNVFKNLIKVSGACDFSYNLFANGAEFTDYRDRKSNYNTFIGVIKMNYYTSWASGADGVWDFTNNYWDKSDENTIKSWITDKTTDITYTGTVKIKPFLSAPHKDTPTLK